MKILIIGDFHGKFPVKLQKLVKGVALIVSVGDYFPFSYRKLWFKYCYGEDIELWEIIGKKKMRDFISKDLIAGEKVLKKLNGLGVPVVSVIGNLDYTNINDQYSKSKKGKWEWYEQDFFSKIIKKYENIRRFDYKYAQFGGLNFVGGFGHTTPGQVKSKAYRRYKLKLDKLFKRFKKENEIGKVIFVFHNMPYNCKLDKISTTSSDGRKIKGHYGSKLIRRVINRHQPVLAIGGHMHENQGKCKIGKTLVVNPGAAVDGKCAIVDFNIEKGSVKSIKFVR